MKGLLKKQTWYATAGLFGLYVVSMLAVIRSDAYYADDILRAYTGGRNWYDWGRYISEYLSPFLHISTRLQDISPLPQLIALFLCAVAGIVLIRVLTGESEIKPLQLIAMLPLAINPCFLGCLSYKYDAPYMALSVFLSVLPLLFCEGAGHRNRMLYFCITTLCTLGMCLSYQASSCIFPIVVIFLIMKRWCSGVETRELVIFGALSAAGFLAGQLVFKIFVLDLSDAVNDPGFYSLREFLPGWFANIRLYITRIYGLWNRVWIVLTVLLVLSAVVMLVRRSVRNKILSLVFCLAGTVAMILCLYGSLAVLRELDDNPRMMYGIGVFIAIAGCHVVSEKKAVAEKAVCILLAWCFFVFAFQYGNALAEQKRYVEFRSTLLISDLIQTDIMKTDDKKTVEISGEFGMSDIIENMNYDIVKALLQNEVGDWSWYKYYLRFYFKLETMANIRPYDALEEVMFSKEDLPLLVDTPYHAIYGEGDAVWIELKEP